MELAPTFDSAPTMHLSPQFDSSGHVINGRTRINHIGVEDLVVEGIGFGLSRRMAHETVDETFRAVFDAAHRAPLPDGAERVLPALTALLAERNWPR